MNEVTIAPELKLMIPKSITPRLYVLLKANKRLILLCPPAESAPMIIENKAIYSIKKYKFLYKGENTLLIRVIKQERYAKGGIKVKNPQIGRTVKLMIPIKQE